MWTHTPSYIYTDGVTHKGSKSNCSYCSDMSVSKRIIERKGRAPEPIAACDRGTLRSNHVTFLSGRSSRSISSGCLPWCTGRTPSSPRNVSDSTSRYFPPLVFCTLVPLASGWVLNTLWVLVWLSLCFKPSPWWPRPCSSLASTSSSSQSPLVTTDLLPLLCFSAKLSWLRNKSFLLFICSPYLLSFYSP